MILIACIGQFMTLLRGWNSFLVVCWAHCPACCSVMGVIHLYGEFSGRGYFSLGVSMRSYSIPPKLFRIKVWSVDTCIPSHILKGPDIRVLDGWMLVTKTYPAYTIHENGMWLVTYTKISPIMVNPTDTACEHRRRRWLCSIYSV